MTIPKLDSSGCGFLMWGLRWQEVSHLHRPLLTPAPVAQSTEASAEPAPLPGAQISARFSSQKTLIDRAFLPPNQVTAWVHSTAPQLLALGAVCRITAMGMGPGWEGVPAARLLTRGRSRPAPRFLWQRRNLHISSWTYRCKSKGKPVTFLKSESKLIRGMHM